MKTAVTSVVVAALALLFLQVSGAHAQSGPPAAGNAQNGKTAFLKFGCYACHGTVGQGGAGARLAPNPLTAAGFATYVRKGSPGRSVFGGMPGYESNILPDSDLANILAYLASIPPPPPVKSVPLLND